MKEKSPTWYASRYRGEFDYKTLKIIIHNTKPLRCPYCGTTMNFTVFDGYEVKSSDWYWQCLICHLQLGNRHEFSKEFLSGARKHWRKHLLKEMTGSKERYYLLKEQYETYGINFTPKEKGEVLVETIEQHTKEEPIK